MALSPERQRLADLIARRRAIEQERATLAKAAHPAWEAVQRAGQAAAAARERVEQAQQQAIDRRIAALAGAGQAEAPAAIEDARQRLRVAEDDMVATREALAEIEKRQQANELTTLRKQDVEQAARAVMWSEVRPLIPGVVAATRAAMTAYARQWAIASFLHGLSPFPFPADDPDAAELRSVVHTIDTPPAHWPGPRGGPDPAQAWRDALAALQADASAKLPRG
jgi:hypothetical protein